MEEASPELIRELCTLLGVDSGYHDIWGKWHETSANTQRRFLTSFGIPDGKTETIQGAIDRIRGRIFEDGVEPVIVTRESSGVIPIAMAFGDGVPDEQWHWKLAVERADVISGEFNPTHLPIEGAVRKLEISLNGPAGAIGLGYHTLDIRRANGTRFTQTIVIVSPDRCFTLSPKQQWGISVQLYALRSATNWGIGDFRDLERLVENVARAGGNFVGLSPLHALFPSDPNLISPYSPSTRAHLNVLYLSIADVAEFEAVRSELATLHAEAQTVSQAPFIDYPKISALKFQAYRALFEEFYRTHWLRETPRAEELRDFIAAGGDELKRYIEHEALTARFSCDAGRPSTWNEWAKGSAIETLADEKEALAFAYLDWIATEQLTAVKKSAFERGMKIGLYLDLALGVNGGGYEARHFEHALAFDMSAGAPPDLLNVQGQVWGLPPCNPEALRREIYRPFREALRTNMKFAGAIRIDHVMGLMRLFWVPAGCSGSEGAYVRYRLDELLGIVALESVRNQCAVIGEDLGTVPDEVRAAMQERGVLSYKVLIFMQKSDSVFMSPQEYPADALVTVSTHDLPTLAGFWNEVDLKERERLNLFSEFCTPEYEKNRRAKDREGIYSMLEQQGLHPRGGKEQLLESVLKALTRTPCSMFAIQLEDLLYQEAQMNLPGTVNEHPNWNRRYTIAVDSAEFEELMKRTAAVVGV